MGSDPRSEVQTSRALASPTNGSPGPVSPRPERDCFAEAEDMGFYAARLFPGMPADMIACPFYPRTPLHDSWRRGFQIGRMIDLYKGNPIPVR